MATIETLRFWCQKVLPLVYDDSLSYYELLCKVVTKTNEIIATSNSHSDNIETLQEEYSELDNKVEGLIQNLIDVIVPWSSEIAYRVFTIVSYLGTNYIAIQDVPIGIMITNTDYWVEANTVTDQINAIGVVTSQTHEELETLNESRPVNVLTLGVKNDGTEDCSDIIENASEEMSLYFPAGVYLFNRGITLKNSIVGAFRSRGYNREKMNGSILLFTSVESGDCIYSDIDKLSITNIGICAGNNTTGIHLQGVESLYTLHGVDVVNALIGIHVEPTGGSSRCLNMDECSVWGPYTEVKQGTIGVQIDSLAYDSIIDRCEIMATQTGVLLNAPACSVMNSHIWPSGLTGADYWNSTRCVVVNTSTAKVIGCILDTAVGLVDARADATIEVTNCFATYDASAPSDANMPTMFIATNPQNAIIDVDGFVVNVPDRFTNFYFNDYRLNGHRKNIRVSHGRAFPYAPILMDIGSSYNTTVVNPTGTSVIEVARMSGIGAFVLTVGRFNNAYAARVMRNNTGTVTIKRLQGTLNVATKVENGYVKIYAITDAATPTVINVLNLSAYNNLVDPVHTMYYGSPLKNSFECLTDETGLTRATVES